MWESYHLQSSIKQVAIFGSMQHIWLLKHSNAISWYMVEVAVLEIKIWDVVKICKSRLNRMNFTKELWDLEGKVRLCNEVLNALINSRKSRYSLPKSFRCSEGINLPVSSKQDSHLSVQLLTCSRRTCKAWLGSTYFVCWIFVKNIQSDAFIFSSKIFLMNMSFLWKEKWTFTMFEYEAQKTLMRLEEYPYKVRKLQFLWAIAFNGVIDHFTLMKKRPKETVICSDWMIASFQCCGRYRRKWFLNKTRS